MTFWKVFYTGKVDETVKVDCGGSYTVSANSSEEAQAEAAGMAYQDGITDVAIQSCAPLQNSESWTSEGFTSTTNYTPFSTTTVPPQDQFVFAVPVGYFDYGDISGLNSTNSDYTPYSTYSTNNQNTQQACENTPDSGYNPYTNGTDDSDDGNSFN